MMAKLGAFDPFADATPPVADAARETAPETRSETPKPRPSTDGPRTPRKPRQRAPQAPDGASRRRQPRVLTPVEAARWEHWVNASAGKLGKTLTGATGVLASATAFEQTVADARAAGVSDLMIQAAAMRALANAPDAVAALVAALRDVPDLQRAVVSAAREAAYGVVDDEAVDADDDEEG